MCRDGHAKNPTLPLRFLSPWFVDSSNPNARAELADTPSSASAVSALKSQEGVWFMVHWRKKGDRQPGVMHLDLAAFEPIAVDTAIVW